MPAQIIFPSSWKTVSEWPSKAFLEEADEKIGISPFEALMPDAVSPSHFIVPEWKLTVRNQGFEIPCCVSMATIACMEILDFLNRYSTTKLSPLFNYYMARGGGAPTTFLTLLDGLNSAVGQGVSPEILHPSCEGVSEIVTRRLAEAEPSGEAINKASSFRIFYHPKIAPIVGYIPLTADGGIDSWKRYIFNNNPIMLALWLTEEYEDMHNSGNYYYEPSPSTIKEDRGHAITVFGFDDHIGGFRVLDSRGTAYFDQGFWWLSYNSLDSRIIPDVCAVIKLSY